MFRGSKFEKFSKFQKVKIIFFEDGPICVLYFLGSLVIIGRATGPDFDQIFEVPEIIQKVLGYDRGP